MVALSSNQCLVEKSKNSVFSFILTMNWCVYFSFHHVRGPQWHCVSEESTERPDYRGNVVHSSGYLQVSTRLFWTRCWNKNLKCTMKTFLVLPRSSPDYYTNLTSSQGMQDVLVITLPQRNYTTGSNLMLNDTVRAVVPTWRCDCLYLTCLSIGR